VTGRPTVEDSIVKCDVVLIEFDECPTGTKLYCLVTKAHVGEVEQLAYSVT